MPAWFAMCIVQNWNSYSNSLNSATIFLPQALTPPGITNEFYPDPTNSNIHLKTTEKTSITVLGLVPFSSPASTAAG
ncbi:hypothetical protein V8E51_004487 [Hyaloscypha variabilis]